MFGNQGPRILVIDDDVTQRMLVKEYLEQAGYQVRASDNGSQGLKLAEKSPADLIIVDYLLPSADGLEVCASLRRNRKTRDVPIILITGSNDVDIYARSLSAGATDFIEKPVQWEQLADRVRHVLERNEAISELRSTAISHPPATEPVRQVRPVPARGAETPAMPMPQPRAETPAPVPAAQVAVPLPAFAPVPQAQWPVPASDAIERSYWNAATALSFEQSSLANTLLETIERVVAASGLAKDRNTAPILIELRRQGQALANSLSSYNTLAGMMTNSEPFSPRDINLKHEIQAMVAWFTARFRGRQLSMFATVNTDLPVRGDAQKLRVLLDHIVMNAMASASQVSIAIAAEVRPDQSVVVTVQDNGIGMLPAVLNKVRASLQRPENMQTKADNRVGLGIPIASAIARLHGGYLQFESQLGMGTTVSLVLPPPATVTARYGTTDVPSAIDGWRRAAGMA